MGGDEAFLQLSFGGVPDTDNDSIMSEDLSSEAVMGEATGEGVDSVILHREDRRPFAAMIGLDFVSPFGLNSFISFGG
jgi:hypothetical protein